MTDLKINRTVKKSLGVNLDFNSSFALFGGSFSPPHIGHFQIYDSLKRDFKFEQVIVIPAGRPRHKKLTLSREARLSLIRKAFKGAKISFLEIRRLAEGVAKKPTYTITTLQYFRKKYPKRKLWFVIGLDSFAQLRSWYKYEELLKYSSFLVFPRAGYAAKARETLKYLIREGLIKKQSVKHSNIKAAYLSLYGTWIGFTNVRIAKVSSTSIRNRGLTSGVFRQL